MIIYVHFKITLAAPLKQAVVCVLWHFVEKVGDERGSLLHGRRL